MNKYTHPAFHLPSDSEITELIPDYIFSDPDINQNEWRSKEANKLNSSRIASSLGEKTGWPSKWAEAVLTEPHGQQWRDSIRKAQTVIEKNGILILHGKRGCGKTRMAADIALCVGQSRYRTAMGFFLEIRASFKNPKLSEMDIISSLVHTDLMVIDELQERGDTPFEDRLLTHLIDARYAEQKPTILIANLTKSEISKSLGSSVVDRIRENGMAIEFTWDSFRKVIA